MCLIVFSYQPDSETPLVLLAHRDEFTARPTARLHWWADQPDILGGRDLMAQGSWLAVHRNGRLAAVTNVRRGAIVTDKRSRGEWISRHLLGHGAAIDTAQQTRNADEYGGFNALFGHWQNGRLQLAYGSNRHPPQTISPGVYGLSNGHFDEPWPKVRQAKAILAALLAQNAPHPDWLAALKLTETAPDDELPDTGIGLVKERWLSPVQIIGEQYGTRAASYLAYHADGRVEMLEQTLLPEQSGRIAHQAYESFNIRA